MTFAADTHADQLDATHWSTPIRSGWDIRGNANGGYLLALCASAMRAHVDRPDPITVTAHYLAPGKVGPATLTAHTIRAGRQLATVSATLTAHDRPVLQLLGSFGDLSARGDFPERIDGGPPTLPAPVRGARQAGVQPAICVCGEQSGAADGSERAVHPLA